MILSLPKLKAILLYFCTQTDPKFLGKVKLMKLFYFLDFGHVKKHGSPVTFDIYVNLEHGPIPTTIKNLVDEVCDYVDSSILADTIFCETTEGATIHRLLPKRKFTNEDKKYFSKSELEMMEITCDRFGSKNTKYVEDISHEEAPWKKTSLLDIIPYSLALQDKDCLATREEIEFVTSVYAN